MTDNFNSPPPGVPQTEHKAWATLLSGLAGVAAMFIPGVEEVLPPEVIAALAVVVATFATWAIPNRPK
jgi:hypothetical protein